MLKKWNEKNGCDLEGNIKTLEERIRVMDDLRYKRKLSETEEEEVKRLNVVLWEAINLKESIWWQK